MVGSGEDRGQERGQATVELALILPLLVLCLAGLVWVGHVMTMQVRVEHAAREGARAAAIEPEVAAAVASRAVAASMGDEAQTFTIVEAEWVVVRVTTTVAGAPLVGVGGRTLVAEAHMRREDINN